MALRIANEMVDVLRYKLRESGINLDIPAEI